MSWIQTTFGIFLKAIFFFVPKSICVKFFRVLSFEVFQSSCLPVSISKFLSTNVFQSSCLLVSVPKLLSTYVCIKVLYISSVSQSFYLPMFVSKFLSTSVFQNSCLHVYVSKLLSTNCVSKLLSTFFCVKVFVYLCMSQSFYLPLFVYMNFGRFMNFEIHHKHGLLYHTIFAKVYQRLWIFKLLKVHFLCATICFWA
jgi:hypothetical protein